MDQTAHRLFFPISQSWYVIQNGDIKGIAGRITITIDQYNAEAFAQGGVIDGSCMVFIIAKGIAVTDLPFTGRGVVGHRCDGQYIS